MLYRIIGGLLLIISIVAAWLVMDFNRFSETPMDLPEAGLSYLLKPGTSVNTVARGLEQSNTLSSALYLRILARLDGSASKIKAGEYLIPSGTTPEQLLALFVSGKVKSYSLTLVEGWTFRQMLGALEKHDALVHTLEGLNDADIMAKLGYEGEHPEGRFLADTYHFPKGLTDVAFLKRAYKAQHELLTLEWKERDKGLPLKSPYEALILASIIEKETGVASERAEISGVFIRRLHKNMKLQTDPTVIYGMGDRYNGNIRRRDLREDTPYNTYVHKGLPPTPICLPGADAIHAALHPAKGKALYFVATGNGGHYFSASLEEHNKAVHKYQLKRK